MTQAAPFITPMSDLLAHLIAPPSGALIASRVICADATEDGLAAILREIDLTVLRRVLSFQNAALSELHLEVTGRRLKRVLARRDGDPNIGGIDVASAQGQAALFSVLQSFVAVTGPINVTTQPSGSRSDAGLEGASATTLARAFGLVPIDADVAFPAFIDAACALSTAWLRSDGEVIADYSGPEQKVDALAATLAETDAAPATTPECMLVYAADSNSDLCALARYGTDGAAMLIPAHRKQAVIALWQKHFT